MDNIETNKMAVKLLSRACLHGFISKDDFIEKIQLESNHHSKNFSSSNESFMQSLSNFFLK